MDGKRLFGLDLMRAVAVLLVTFSHCEAMLEPLIHLPFGIGRAFGKMLAMAQPTGSLGIEMLFAASSFLVGGLLVREFAAQKFSFRFVRDFWANRLVRTLPAYYLFFGLNILLAFFLYGKAELDWRYLFFLQSFSTPHPKFFGEAWILPVGAWAFFFLPVLLLAAGNFIKGFPKRRVLLAVLVLYTLFFIGARIANAFDPVFAELGPDLTVRKMVIFRLDAVAYGAIIAYLHHFHGVFLMRPAVRKTLLVIGAALTVGLFLFNFLSFYPPVHLYSRPPFRFLSDAFLYALLPIGISLMLPAAIALKELASNRFRINDLVGGVARIWFMIYLAHFSLIFLPFFQKPIGGGAVAAMLFYFAYWAVTFLVSWLAHRFFEKPVTAWLRPAK